MDTTTFFDNFDRLAEAPNGVAKLREFILQMAVSGKLVPQDSSDGNATEVLENIARVKHEQIVAGCRADESAIPDTCDGERPYPVPSSWCWVRLCRLVDFSAAPKVDVNRISADAWLLDLEDIEKNTSRVVRKVAYRERSSKSTKAGSYVPQVLASISAGFPSFE